MQAFTLRALFKRACVVTLLMGGVCSVAWADPSLAERRAISTYQQDVFAEQLQQIQAAAGFAVPLEVNWNSIAGAGDADSYAKDDYWTNIYFVPLKDALAAITRDDMGKQALKEKLKSIVVHYDEATAPTSNYSAGLSFTDGTLTLNFRPFSNSADVRQRTEAIQKLLEASL